MFGRRCVCSCGWCERREPAVCIFAAWQLMPDEEADPFDGPIADMPAARKFTKMHDSEIELGERPGGSVDENVSSRVLPRVMNRTAGSRGWQAAAAAFGLSTAGLLVLLLRCLTTSSASILPFGHKPLTAQASIVLPLPPPRAAPVSPPMLPSPPSFPPRSVPATPPTMPPPPSPPHVDPVPMIVDTDMSFDVDDVGALCLAHALADRGEISLLATVHDAGVPSGVGAISVLNDYYGRPDVLIGAFKGSFGRLPWNPREWNRGPYIDRLVERFPSSVQDSSQVPDAVRTYRQALAAAADRSVVIAAIGFTTNLAALLNSSSDDLSALSGSELVAQKVRRVVYQGGWYPGGGGTFNWDCGGEWYYHEEGGNDGCAGAAAQVVNGLTALGVEQQFTDQGEHMLTGKPLDACVPRSNPCRDAFVTWLDGAGRGRPSWDEVAVLLAARGSERLTMGTSPGRPSPFYLARGTNVVNARGANHWSWHVSRAGSEHYFLDVRAGVSHDSVRSETTMEMDHLLCQPPKLSKPAYYQSRFAELNRPAPPPSPPAPPMPPYRTPDEPEEVGCGDCWGINGGEEGDCSEVRGCGSWLCDFCTND